MKKAGAQEHLFYTMKNVLFFLLAFGCLASASAREWTDKKGRKVVGLLVSANASVVTIDRMDGTQPIPIALSLLSDVDVTHVKAWIAAQPQAQALTSFEVQQVTKEGAYVQRFEAKWETWPKEGTTRVHQVTQHGYTIGTEMEQGWRYYPVGDILFIQGLNTVPQGLRVRSLQVWQAGFHDYETVAGAAKRVRMFRVNPPVEVNP